MAAMTSSNWDIQNLRKTTLAHVLETICVKFHQNRPSRLGCRAETDRQTDTHTDGQTPWVHPNIQSKWLNIKCIVYDIKWLDFELSAHNYLRYLNFLVNLRLATIVGMWESTFSKSMENRKKIKGTIIDRCNFDTVNLKGWILCLAFG